MAERFGAWLDVLAVDLLGYALMGNHFHIVVRTRPDRVRFWSANEVKRRAQLVRSVHDGMPMDTGAELPEGSSVDDVLRAQLSHPGPMLRAVKEGLARRINREDGTAGHVWESRYHDTHIIDAGGVVACLVYVDLNPFRAGLVRDPARSTFCSARHRLRLDASAADAVLATHLVDLRSSPLLDAQGHPLASWTERSDLVPQLASATARALLGKTVDLPEWSRELLPRLGLSAVHWRERMGEAGVVRGNVLGSWHSRRASTPTGRLPSDKSGLFLSEAESE